MNQVTFLQETVSELRKSVWPTREETARLTVVVIAVAVAVGLFLGLLDTILAAGFAQASGLFAKLIL